MKIIHRVSPLLQPDESQCRPVLTKFKNVLPLCVPLEKKPTKPTTERTVTLMLAYFPNLCLVLVLRLLDHTAVLVRGTSICRLLASPTPLTVLRSAADLGCNHCRDLRHHLAVAVRPPL